jgi:signal transduction histidine kinase
MQQPGNNKPRDFGIRLTAIALGLTAIFFVADLMVPLGLAVWVPYAALVLFSLWSPYKRFPLLLAATCTVLLIIGFLYSPSGDILPPIDLFNRSLGVLVIWVIGILCLLRLGMEEALSKAREELETRVRKRTVELERANQIKDEFLGFVSHELKTPVNVIRGYSEILRDKTLGDINKDQEQALEKVIKSSDELSKMIQGLLDAGRLEAGAVKVDNHETDLAKFLKELKAIYEAPIEKGLRLNWDHPADLPVIKTDSEKLKHILQNLINNAVQYTSKGRVTVSVRYVVEGNRVEFEVADTGIGIPEDELPHIFEMFHQGDGDQPRRRDSVGLGLYIVKKFTELLGGKIEADSRPGKGSTFRVSLPCER